MTRPTSCSPTFTTSCVRGRYWPDAPCAGQCAFDMGFRRDCWPAPEGPAAAPASGGCRILSTGLGLVMQDAIHPLLDRLRARCQQHYGDRLISVVVFGSVARGTAGPESDLDMLVVADGLPDGRVARGRDFLAVEREM